MRYSEEKIEQVRQQNDIVDVIGRYVRLKRAGSNYVGLCPFHNEKTPSFSVSESKQMYKCFGCGVSGNVITFIMEYENLSFPEAVQSLADRAGIALPQKSRTAEEKRQEGQRSMLLKLNEKAARYYYAMLKSAQGRLAYDYLKNRGLSDETMTRFGLGYAGQGGDNLYRYLKKEGYTDTQLRESGLFKMSEKGVYDKFWNRVIFPIMDVGNHVIGFGGRVMGDGQPKYLNSPETIVFDKSMNLFGLNYAKQGKRDAMILCEGYMDVIALQQAGFINAVASLGTAFTQKQALLLKRYTKEVLLTYDSDGAGQKAALRAISILREVDLSGRVVHLEPYKDPDELIQAQGAEEFEKRLKEAQNGFLYEGDRLKESYDMSDPESKTAFYHALAKKLLVFEDKVKRDNYLEAAAARYGIRRDDLQQLVIRYSGTTAGYVSKEKPKPWGAKQKKEENGIEHSYRLLLSWLAEEPALYPQIKQLIQPEDFCSPDFKEVADLLYRQLDSGAVSPAGILDYFEDIEKQKHAARILQTDFAADLNPEEKEKALNELVFRIKEYSIDMQMRNMTDLGQLQNLILKKKQWQTPESLHISLKNG